MFLEKFKKKSYEEFLKQKNELGVYAKKPNRFLIFVLTIFSTFYLKFHRFKMEKSNIDKNILKQPCLILMNHVNHIDFKIMFYALRKMRFNVITADDSFVGRKKVLQRIGCFSTFRFEPSPILVKETQRCLRELKNSVVVYPEASFSSDGLSNGISSNFGKFVKFCNVPVLYLSSIGTYQFSPNYTNKFFKAKISAKLELLFDNKQIQKLTDKQIQLKVSEIFNNINYYKYQKDNKILLKEDYRAEGLEFFIYKCPKCGKEHYIKSKNSTLICNYCHNVFNFNENGCITDSNDKILFDDLSNWINWQKDSLKKEIIEDKYRLDLSVKLVAYKNYSSFYDINTIAIINANKNGYTINCDKGQYYFSTKEVYDLCSRSRVLIFNNCILTRDKDIRYICLSINNDGKAYKMKNAIKIAYNLTHKNN